MSWSEINRMIIHSLLPLQQFFIKKMKNDRRFRLGVNGDPEVIRMSCRNSNMSCLITDENKKEDEMRNPIKFRVHFVQRHHYLLSLFVKFLFSILHAFIKPIKNEKENIVCDLNLHKKINLEKIADMHSLGLNEIIV